MTSLRRLDHVAIAVRDTDVALDYFRDRLGLPVVHGEELPELGVRLTYLDAGNAYIQLVEPLSPSSPIAGALEKDGEGLHHICFGVDDVPASVEGLSGQAPPSLGSGRGRVSAFLPDGPAHGVRVECTEFRFDEDVRDTAGWRE